MKAMMNLELIPPKKNQFQALRRLPLETVMTMNSDSIHLKKNQ